LFLLLES